MAIIPNPDGTVSVTDDVTGATLSEGIPPDMLGSLYNPGAVAPPPTEPDLRTATGPANAPPGMADWIRGQGQSTAAPQSKMSHVPVTQQYQPGDPGLTSGQAAVQRRLAGPESGAPSTSASVAAGPIPASSTGLESSYAGSTEQGLRDAALKLMQPRGGAMVDRKPKNVLKNFQVEVAQKLSPESKEELGLARELGFTRAGILTAEKGMVESASAEDQALSYERQRQEAKVQLAGIQQQERDRDRIVGARIRELDMLGDELHSKRANARFGAEAYWEDKGVFGTIMAKIGMALYAGGGALAGYDPMGLAKQINAEAENYNAGKRVEFDLLGKEIEGKESQLERVRSQFVSRDAAEHATRALMNDAMAAEAATLASSYKSAEAQNTALQLINQLKMQSAEAKAAAELAEKDAITQAWMHDPGFKGVVGGSRGLDITEVAKKFFPGDPEGVLKAARLVQEGKLPHSKQDFETWKAQQKGSTVGSATMEKFYQQGKVRLPDGRVFWTPHGPDQASRHQELLAGMPAMRENLKRIKDLLSGVATPKKGFPDARGEIKALVAKNAVLFKAKAKEALTQGENKELWSKLTGADAAEFMTWANEEKQLETAIQATIDFEHEEIGKLEELPPGIDPGRPASAPIEATPEEEKE